MEIGLLKIQIECSITLRIKKMIKKIWKKIKSWIGLV
jgi:hypothetical protein